MTRSRLSLAVMLAAIAGWVDAVGYLHFAQVFVSFMSGNSTVLAMDLGRGRWTHALSPALAIASFVLGSFLGSLVGLLAGAWRPCAVLAFEAILLGLAFLVPASGGELAPAIAPIAIAMGAQNAVMLHAAGVRVSLAFFTGALFNVGEGVAKALLGKARRWTWGVHAVIWIGLMIGSVAGAIAHQHIGFGAFAAPAVALGVLGVIEVIVVAMGRSARSVTGNEVTARRS